MVPSCFASFDHIIHKLHHFSSQYLCLPGNAAEQPFISTYGIREVPYPPLNQQYSCSVPSTSTARTIMNDFLTLKEQTIQETGEWQPQSTNLEVSDDTAGGQSFYAFSINSAMQESLARANKDKRLIGGFKKVLETLENSHKKVLFCIIPENLWNEPDKKCFFKMVVSLCNLHNVKMIKVDHDQLVRKIIETTSCNSPDSRYLAELSYECILIMQQQSVRDCLLPCDNVLIDFYQTHEEEHGGGEPALINLIES